MFPSKHLICALFGILTVMPIGLAGCDPDALPSASGTQRPPSVIVSKETERGALRVNLSGDFSSLRSAQAQISDISTVSVSVVGTNYSKTQEIGRSELATGGASASATFDAIPPGTASATVTAYDATFGSIGIVSGSTTIISNQTTTLSLTLQLIPTYVSPTPSPTPSPSPAPGSLATNVNFLDGPIIKLGLVSTIVGNSGELAGPHGVDVDSSGNLYVADTGNHRICKISPSGIFTILAGRSEGYWDGTGAVAKFDYPQGIVVDGNGNAYVADTWNNRIRKVTPSGVVTTFVGNAQGYFNGIGTDAQFTYPYDVAVDISGNIFVADNLNYRIRKVTPTAVVTTFAGSAKGYVDGTGSSAWFNEPAALAIDGSSNIFVADRLNHRIRKITPSGVVTTLAGSTQGFADGTGTAAKFDSPSGITVDSKGNVYVSDTGNHRIRMVTPSGIVTTVAGSTFGLQDGLGTAAKFDRPCGIAIDGSGNLYVADSGNSRIRKVVLP